MKKIITILVIIMSTGLFFLLTANKSADGDIESEKNKNILEITMFTKNGKRTNIVSFYAPFLQGYENPSTVNIAVDMNGDTIFSDDEYFIQNKPVISDIYTKYTYYTSENIVFTDDLLAQVEIDGAEFTTHTITKIFESKNTLYN